MKRAAAVMIWYVGSKSEQISEENQSFFRILIAVFSDCSDLGANQISDLDKKSEFFKDHD